MVSCRKVKIESIAQLRSWTEVKRDEKFVRWINRWGSQIKKFRVNQTQKVWAWEEVWAFRTQKSQERICLDDQK